MFYEKVNNTRQRKSSKVAVTDGWVRMELCITRIAGSVTKKKKIIKYKRTLEIVAELLYS